MSTPPLYRLALAAFQDAQARLHENLADILGPGRALVSAMEAAYWANSLDLRLRHDDPSYKGLNGDGPDLIRALRFVRNRAAHQLPLVVETTGGIRAPLVFPLTVEPLVIRWVSAASPPSADERHKGPKGEALYVKRMEGREVRGVLKDVGHWLSTEQSRPGSLLS
ncbi:hypothetical protein I6J39_34795 (plasmid) [Streptomyces californicus]|uniref:Uncharacterized protein n=1 Tax=Streptomyces californicus TaxID=67351 RepID=A0ABX7JE83_9ACTN|nr:MULTISPECIES: hypothetical protein [Streptomyces]QRV32515.1 hypothetical protein I6J39_34795 [Streptomyces californicus]QRV45930.1 hypothetical protein I6J41_34720 [Streptomyces californicus]